jgi:hypothetical protein
MHFFVLFEPYAYKIGGNLPPVADLRPRCPLEIVNFPKKNCFKLVVYFL